MRAKALFSLTLGLTLGLLVVGCSAPQGRADRTLSDADRASMDVQRSLHGGVGNEIAFIYSSDEFRSNLAGAGGRTLGVQGQEFFLVQVAPDPRESTYLVKAGYAIRFGEDRGSMSYYEFYDEYWNLIGRWSSGGVLYKYSGTTETRLGRFEFTAASHQIYNAPSGYGYDPVKQDLARARMSDPNVAQGDFRSRGVSHTTHASAAPIVVVTTLSSGERAAYAARFQSNRFTESENIRQERIREMRDGGVGRDETYGGLQYKDGNPVDDQGRPLRPGALGNK